MNNEVYIGKYIWEQLSMWDFAPEHCIQTFIKSEDGTHIFHYYLTRVTSVISKNHYKIETVIDATKVPYEILNWRNGQWNVK